MLFATLTESDIDKQMQAFNSGKVTLLSRFAADCGKVRACMLLAATSAAHHD